MVSGSLPGRTALIAWILGALCVICCAAAYRRPLDYNGDGSTDAIRAFVFDSRYLAVNGDKPSVMMSPGRELPANEPLEIGRDVRLVPPVPSTESEHGKQIAYLASYNSTMMVLVHGAARGGPVKRPMPVSRPVFALLLTLVVMPLLLSLYLRYRLGPYRLDGKRWTVSFWDVSWRYMRPSTYAEGAGPLLLLLWISVGIFVPWVFLIVAIAKDKPIR